MPSILDSTGGNQAIDISLSLDNRGANRETAQALGQQRDSLTRQI